MAKDVPPRQRKPGRSQSIDGINSRIDEGFDEESDFLNKSKRRSNDNGSNTTSGLGSDDLQSRGSLQFIDVKVSRLETALLNFATSYHQKTTYPINSKTTRGFHCFFLPKIADYIRVRIIFECGFHFFFSQKLWTTITFLLISGGNLWLFRQIVNPFRSINF